MATPSLDTLDILSPDHYQQNGYPHEEWSLLRREAPIYWYTRTPGVPFWAVTKYQDIITISKQSRKLLNSPRLGAFPRMRPEQGRGSVVAVRDGSAVWRYPAGAVLEYEQPDADLTLSEGLAEYRRANPGLKRSAPGHAEAESFFGGHDAVHVVFGCTTTLPDEILADAWTLFGTTVSVRRFLGFLRLEEHREIVAGVHLAELARALLRVLPALPRLVAQSRRMTRPWPWDRVDDYLDWPLARIRREFGIQVLSLHGSRPGH